jgi:hypothetical protein
VTRWIAYCAPGRKFHTAIGFLFETLTGTGPGEITDIIETPHVTGTTVLLANAAIDFGAPLDLPVQLREILPEAP